MSPLQQPVLFITDFGPMPAFERSEYTDALDDIGRELPRPRAVVVMSGHWPAAGTLGVTGSDKPGLIFDYAGFPPQYYQISYNAPGDAKLAGEVARLMGGRVDARRGLDHGAWVPLTRLYPRANVPILQVTVPAGDDPREIMKIGRALAPLREREVMLVGSGALIHNLRTVKFGDAAAPPEAWAVEFDEWLEKRLTPGGLEDLLDYRQRAPQAKMAAPTTEHFDPLFYVLGAASLEGIEHHFRAIRYGTGLMRIFTLS